MKTKCRKCGLELLESEMICPQCGEHKRKNSKYLSRFILLFFSAAVLTLTFAHIFQVVTYNIPAEIAEKMFGKTVEEFCQTDGEGTAFDGYLTSCKTDGNGDLVLKLTPENNENLRQALISKISKTQDKLHFSSEYDEITVYVFKETYVDKAFTLYGHLQYFAVIQLLNGEKAENINVNFSVIDQGTNEVIYSFNRMHDTDDSITFDVNSLSSKYDEHKQ